MKFATSLILLASVGIFGTYGYNGSTKAAVVLAGSVIKAKYVDNNHKYKRKNCPVCKGQGWYLSGDKIKKVDCGYCEPDSTATPPSFIIQEHNNYNCPNGNCKIIKR